MSSVFQLQGGAANPLKQIITLTSATNIIIGSGTQANQGQYNIPYFRVNEYAGGTPTLTVEIYDGTNSFFLGSGGFTWNAKAMTAKQSLLFDDGYAVGNGSFLRITASVGSQVLIQGVYIGKQQAATWQQPGK